MTYEMQKFDHELFGKLTGITDNDGNPWFVGKEVALALGYTNSKKAIIDHCKSPKLLKGHVALPLTSSPRGINIIPESDLFRLVMKSQLEGAVEFQDWVCEDVLPSIRKTGGYVATELESTSDLLPEEIGLKSLRANIAIAKILGLEGNLAILSANNATFVQHKFNPMEQLGVTELVSVDQVQYFTPSIIGKTYGYGARKVNRLLESAGFQVERRDHKNNLVWQVTPAGKKHCQIIDTNKRFKKMYCM